MTDDEKRIQRTKLKTILASAEELRDHVQRQIGDLCHPFSESDLISLGWTKGYFSGPYMAYEYNKGKKTVVFLDKSNEVLSYSGSPTKFFEDIQELIDYGNGNS